MRYRLIALDLDGTLLNPQGCISAANRRAIERAQQAGALVAPCTGRSWRESRQALRDFPNPGPGVFVTGAMVADVATGRAHDLAMVEPHVALEIVSHLADLPEAVLVCQDRALAGQDYLITGRGQINANTQWWFAQCDMKVRFAARITVDDLHHCLRVGVVASGARVKAMNELIRQRLGEQVSMQHFRVQVGAMLDDDIHLLEIFGPQVDKWRGLRWLAQQHDIAPEQIAAIGDDVNDLAALANAGCGVAMGNAVEAARAAARHQTRSNDADGVAYALDQMLAGAW